MNFAKVMLVAGAGLLSACANGGNLSVGGLDYNSINGNFSGLPQTNSALVPTAGQATYVGSFSAGINSGATVEGGANLAADFGANTVSLKLLSPGYTSTIAGVINGNTIAPSASSDIIVGQFYNTNGEVAAGVFESAVIGAAGELTYAKGQFITERVTPCSAGVCP